MTKDTKALATAEAGGVASDQKKEYRQPHHPSRRNAEDPDDDALEYYDPKKNKRKLVHNDNNQHSNRHSERRNNIELAPQGDDGAEAVEAESQVDAVEVDLPSKTKWRNAERIDEPGQQQVQQTGKGSRTRLSGSGTKSQPVETSDPDDPPASRPGETEDALSRNTSQGSSMVPGAYAVAPAHPAEHDDGSASIAEMELVEEGLSGTQGEEPMSGSARNVGSGPQEPLLPSSDGLAVANPVADDNIVSSRLPLAEDYDELAQTEERQQEARQFTKKVLLGVFLFIVVLVGVLVAALFDGNKESAAADAAEELPASESPQTTAPGKLPTSFSDSILSIFPKDSTIKILDEPDSAQALAFDWLLEDSRSLLVLPNARVLQRWILATLFFATEGEEWAASENWLNHSAHECDWYKKPDYALMHTFQKSFPRYLQDFFPPDDPEPTSCNEEGVYQHLWLAQNNLGGSLPEELYLLTALKTLSVGYNRIRGHLTSHIGQLRSLEGLDMAFNRVDMTIPSELGLLTKLRHTALVNNDFGGRIPSELWLLTNMDSLNLGRNPRLQGRVLPEIGKFAKLKNIIMEFCNLSGTIPTEIGQATSLELIFVASNRFSGTLPKELMALSKLGGLVMNENSFGGTIPTEWGSLGSLFQLTLHGNLLTGTIPSELGNLTNLILNLNLRNNSLTGSIPTELGGFPRLKELDLDDNQLSEQIPSEFGQLKSMGRLLLANNALSGTVPQELSALQQSLYTLSLEGNPLLSGSIPAGVCNINGTCIGNAREPCEGPFGLSFNCSAILCGCGCPCLNA